MWGEHRCLDGQSSQWTFWSPNRPHYLMIFFLGNVAKPLWQPSVVPPKKMCANCPSSEHVSCRFVSVMFWFPVFPPSSSPARRLGVCFCIFHNSDVLTDAPICVDLKVKQLMEWSLRIGWSRNKITPTWNGYNITIGNILSDIRMVWYFVFLFCC